MKLDCVEYNFLIRSALINFNSRTCVVRLITGMHFVLRLTTIVFVLKDIRVDVIPFGHCSVGVALVREFIVFDDLGVTGR